MDLIRFNQEIRTCAPMRREEIGMPLGDVALPRLSQLEDLGKASGPTLNLSPLLHGAGIREGG